MQMSRSNRVIAIGTEEFLNLMNVVVSDTSDFVLVNEYTAVTRAVKMLGKDLPNIALVDINCPAYQGSDAIRKIKETLPYVEVVAISEKNDDKLVKDCISNGASGFVEKSKDLPIKIQSYLDEVVKGGVAMSPRPMRTLVESLWINPFSPLTKRETEILRLMSEGCTYTEIGRTLQISAETSKTHIRNIYKKLKVNKKSTALDKARMERLV